MKNNNRFGILALVLAVCLLCSLSVSGLAASMEAVPLEEDNDGYFGEYYLTDVGLTLKLPVNAQVEMMLDYVDQKGIGIYIPKYPDTYFAFYAFYDSELEGKSLKPLDTETVQTMLWMISNNYENLSYSTTEAVIPDVRMLRVPEPVDDYYAEHLLALYDGWVLNAMIAQVYDSETPLETLQEEQNHLMRMVFADEGYLKRVQTIALPDSDIALTVPDSMNLRQAPEEDGLIEIYVMPNAPGYQVVALHVLAVKQAEYDGQTVATLDEQTLEAAMVMPTYAKAYDEDSVTVLDDFEGGQPVIAYESDGTNRHLLALRDGWALYASTYPVTETIDPEWIAALQEQAMHVLLGGSQPVADWVPGLTTVQEGNLLKLPLLGGVIDIQIPDGYGVDIWQDNADYRDIYLYALDGSDNYYEITSTLGSSLTGELTIADLYTDQGMKDLCIGVADIISDMGSKAESQLVDYGFGGFPSIHSTTMNKKYEQYYGLIDSHIISVSFTSEDDAITEAESETLMGLMQ